MEATFKKVKEYNTSISEKDLVAVHFRYALIGNAITEEEYDQYFSDYNKRTQDIKDAIIKLLFEDNCKSITSESIKFQTHCYNVNIERVVRDINSLDTYPFITCISNGKGVLTLSV